MTSASSPTDSNSARTITEFEMLQVERANETGRQLVVFVHGLWLLPRRRGRWSRLRKAIYTALTPGRPDDPETVC